MLNIGSYMGGVNLWQNEFEHDDYFSLQSMHDKVLEVVCVCGAWHLGKLQVFENLILRVYNLIEYVLVVRSRVPALTARLKKIAICFLYLEIFNLRYRLSYCSKYLLIVFALL